MEKWIIQAGSITSILLPRVLLCHALFNANETLYIIHEDLYYHCLKYWLAQYGDTDEPYSTIFIADNQNVHFASSNRFVSRCVSAIKFSQTSKLHLRTFVYVVMCRFKSIDAIFLYP